MDGQTDEKSYGADVQCSEGKKRKAIRDYVTIEIKKPF